MNYKIVNIRNILKVIVLLFVIFSMIKSCAKAYSFDKMVSYCTKIVNNEISTNTQVRTNAQKFLTCSNQIRNSIGEANIGDYDNFIISAGYSDTYFTAVSGTANIVHYSGYTNFTANGFNNSWNCYISNSGISSTGFKTVTGQAYVNAFSTYWDESLGLVTGTIPGHNGYFNLMSDSTPFEFSLNNDASLNGYGQYQQTIYSYNYNYTVENWLIGQVDEWGDEYSRIKFYLYGANQDYELTYNVRTETYTNVKNMWLNSNDNKLYFKNLYLYYDQVYSFLIYFMDDDNFVHTSEEYEIIFFPMGTIIENGSVTTMGSGDYTIQNATGQIVSTITSGDQAIINSLESGERAAEQRNNWWKDTYNSLFSLDSGDINDLYEQVSGELAKFGEYSNYGEELELLESLRTTQPTDFVISWDKISYKDIDLIPAGELNFNTIIEEWGLEEVHSTLQVIVVASLVFLMLKGVYRCIAITIGIGTEMTDDLEDENAIVESQHETWNYNTGEATISTTRRQGRNSVTVVGKSKIRKRIE